MGDSYWLYVVWDPLGQPNPVPLMICNSVKHLDHVKPEVVAARYYDIPAEAIEVVRVAYEHVGVQGATAFFEGFAQPVRVGQVVIFTEEIGLAVVATLDTV